MQTDREVRADKRKLLGFYYDDRFLHLSINFRWQKQIASKEGKHKKVKQKACTI